MRHFLRRHRIAFFILLAFAFSWYPWLIALARGQTTGPNPLGPLFAGVIAAAIVSGRARVGDYLRQLVRGRVGASNYAAAFGLPIVFCFLTMVIAFLLFPHLNVSAIPTEKIRELPERFIFILLFVGLGEEPSWRGYLLPELQRTNSPAKASLIIAPIWALWHLPLLGHEFSWPVVPPFLVSVLGATLVLTWLYNRSRGSVLLTMLMHATVNTIAPTLMFPLFSGEALVGAWWIYGSLWTLAGLGLLWQSGKEAIAPPLRKPADTQLIA